MNSRGLTATSRSIYEESRIDCTFASQLRPSNGAITNSFLASPSKHLSKTTSEGQPVNSTSHGTQRNANKRVEYPPNIDIIAVRVAARSVKRVDPAVLAKRVLGHVRVERVDGQRLRSRKELERRFGYDAMFWTSRKMCGE